MKPRHHAKPSRRRRPSAPRRLQRGALTIFTGIFVLVLMTLMLLYATRVGVFEQRVSSNEMRQKMAFHAAETALEQATEYLIGNKALVNSSDPEAGPDGLNTDPPGYRPGWFFDDVATRRWRPCQDADVTDIHHPCGGEAQASAGSFYYDIDNDNSTRDTIPLNTGALPAGTTARATATLCILDYDNFGTMACDTNEPDPEGGGGIVLVTLMGYGYSDCIDANGNGLIENGGELASCKGEATVSIPVTSLSNVGGGAGVPLVTKNTLPTTGTAEIVVNPNAGGIGVPASVWANGNNTCPPLDDSGAESDALGHSATSWATCERHEWFGVGYWPDPLGCPTSSCKCDTSELISGPIGGSAIVVNQDIVVDPAFPCDLFEFYFDVPRNLYEVVKANAEVLSDCSSLNQSSSGFIWISGDQCLINSNTVIGTEKNPVMLVIASASTDIRGGAVVYGTMFVTDVEVPGAYFEANGGLTAFGQVVVDCLFSKLQGTFQIVYDEGILARAADAGGLGILNHGWRDWGLPDITW